MTTPTEYEKTFGDMDWVRRKFNEVFESSEFKIFLENTKYPRFEPENIVKTMKRKETDETILEKEMTFLIQLFLNKGSNVHKIMDKCGKENKKLLAALVRKYAIVNNVKGAGATAITLSRLTAIFPIITAKLLVETEDKDMDRPFPHSKMLEKVDQFPKILTCNATASLIPTDFKDFQIVLDAICAYTAHEAIITNASFKGKLDDAGYKCRTYVEAAFQSALISNEERTTICCTALFKDVFETNSDGTKLVGITKAVKEAAEYFKTTVIKM